ncbi:MAG: pyruvate kinase [Bacteroidia bacterium]|nr:pyruvate kinase [Bacteroidia bacterium]MDW8158920.1 pyruvate kinase [Bacteroidia bacterium]
MISTTWNRTKIIATLGPACSSKEEIIAMVQAGVNVFRINASHSTHEEMKKLITLIRTINSENNLYIPVLLDLQGPKIRIGNLERPIKIHPGDVLQLCCTINELAENKIPVQYETLARDVKPDDLILVEDGKVELRVLATDGMDNVRVQVISGTEIGSRKGVNLPYTKISLPSVTEKDYQDLLLGIENQVEWIALSFVRQAQDVLELKRILAEKGSHALVIAKIEKPEALINIDAIIAATDAVMIARGDLGVEIPYEEVPFWQKRIIHKCNLAGKPVIVATQMLDSMIEKSRPTRAESTDVANAVLDGADALMLSGETSIGKYPIESVKVMQRIITNAEQEKSIYNRNLYVDENSPTFLSDSTCVTACHFANLIKAKAIVGMTRSGYTAYQLSKCRPHAPIFIFTDNVTLLSTLNLVWGVRALYYDSFESTDSTIRDVVDILKQKGWIKTGDTIVNMASMPLQARKRTNMIKYTVVD